MRSRVLARAGVLFAWLVLFAGRVDAHAQGETYIWLNVEPTHFAGTMQIRVPDLRDHLELDIPEDLEAARVAVRDTRALVAAYIRANVTVTVDGRPLELQITEADALPAPRFGHFASYTFRTPELEMPTSVTIESRLLFDADPRQRSLICIEYDRIRDVTYGEEYTAAILTASRPEATLALDDVRSLIQLREIARQGAIVWSDPRHGLFVLAMFLPLAVTVPGGRRDPDADTAATLRPRRTIARGAGGMLLAFSIPAAAAFIAAAAGVLVITPAVTTGVAAASVLVLGIAALMSVGGVPAAGLAGLFGLFHGAAFAGQLLELPFRMQDLVRAIVLFGGGLGLVQLAAMIGLSTLLIALAARPRDVRRVGLVAGGLAAVAGATLLLMPLMGAD